MEFSLKESFLNFYNQSMPKWKNIRKSDLIQDKCLDKIISSIEFFIQQNNLDPKKLANSVIEFYFKKNNRYPHIFLFKGNIALSIYKNSNLSYGSDPTEIQKIIISVKKSKILVKNMEDYGIIYSKGVKLIQQTKKADFYYLLAHGIREGIPEQIVTKWDESIEIKKAVVQAIRS